MAQTILVVIRIKHNESNNGNLKNVLKYLWVQVMDLIILNDGLYSLLAVTKQMIAGVEMVSERIALIFVIYLELHLTTYHESWNEHLMKDGSGIFWVYL